MYNLLKKLYRNKITSIAMKPMHWLLMRCMPEKIYSFWVYKQEFGKYPNIKNPRSLNEKLQWLKLYRRDPIKTLCSDKYLVRDYVRERIGEKYLIPLYYHTKNAENLCSDVLPDIPVIIKTNHDSCGGEIIYDKQKVDWKGIRQTLKKRLKSNYYYFSKEWQYKNIEPRIIVEKLLVKNGKLPYDFKVHCFNGKAVTIQVDLDRSTKHRRNWYNTQWIREPFHWSSRKKDGSRTIPSEKDIEKPALLEEMLNLSEKLSKDFLYARIDWYIFDNKLFFGEITFHHDNGNRKFEPEEWDNRLGDMLNLECDKL